jgi:hypothetical protein
MNKKQANKRTNKRTSERTNKTKQNKTKTTKTKTNQKQKQNTTPNLAPGLLDLEVLSHLDLRGVVCDERRNEWAMLERDCRFSDSPSCTRRYPADER